MEQVLAGEHDCDEILSEVGDLAEKPCSLCTAEIDADRLLDVSLGTKMFDLGRSCVTELLPDSSGKDNRRKQKDLARINKVGERTDGVGRAQVGGVRQGSSSWQAECVCLPTCVRLRVGEAGEEFDPCVARIEFSGEAGLYGEAPTAPETPVAGWQVGLAEANRARNGDEARLRSDPNKEPLLALSRRLRGGVVPASRPLSGEDRSLVMLHRASFTVEPADLSTASASVCSLSIRWVATRSSSVRTWCVRNRRILARHARNRAE